MRGFPRRSRARQASHDAERRRHRSAAAHPRRRGRYRGERPQRYRPLRLRRRRASRAGRRRPHRDNRRAAHVTVESRLRMARKPPRIVVVGAGVAGSLVASGLAGRDDVEVICLEKVESAGQADAGTGLNIGPNAIKSLMSVMPERAETIVANSLPWRRWTIGCTDGRQLMDLPLEAVADNFGVRIRWSELYALLRQPIARNIVYGAELLACGLDEGRMFVQYVDTRAG